jgi:hypothetical protein
MARHIIKGIWASEDGYQAGSGKMDIEIATDGKMWDPEIGPSMLVTCEVWGNDAPILTNKLWTFWPNEAELTRLAITPVKMG